MSQRSGRKSQYVQLPKLNPSFSKDNQRPETTALTSSRYTQTVYRDSTPSCIMCSGIQRMVGHCYNPLWRVIFFPGTISGWMLQFEHALFNTHRWWQGCTLGGKALQMVRSQGPLSSYSAAPSCLVLLSVFNTQVKESAYGKWQSVRMSVKLKLRN